MGSCWKQKAKDYLWAQIGEPCGKTSKYAAEMDAVNYYNYPKNGVANSCALFCDNALFHSCTEPSYDEDPEGAKWTALAAMYEPQGKYQNAGAGCVQKVNYFKKADAWYDNPQDFCEMDEIFFWQPKYVSDENPYGVYHTGTIVEWGYIEELNTDGFTVIEGNTTYEGESGRVGYKYYAYDDPLILGAGRPNWDGWLPPDEEDTISDPTSEPEPEPVPEPDPEPTPEPILKAKRIRVSSWLNVRTTPIALSDNSNKIGELYDGAVVYIFEEKDEWSRIGENMWISSNFFVED